MKITLVVTVAFAVANAGVQELSSYEELKELQLWAPYCAAGPRGQTIRETQVYCIESRYNITINEPPSHNYNHQLHIQGGSGESNSVSIYVLPQKNTHQVQYSYIPGTEILASKPTVYFLKGN